MEFKPKIFIGSSKEGKAVAEKLKKSLEDIGDVDMWTTIFEYGSSNYDNLQSQVLFYDYAVLVATTDDITISRGTSFSTARDNVLFEFGLFAGGLGREKVLYMVEDGVKIPSDLSGITLPFFPKQTSPDFDNVFSEIVHTVKKYVVDREATFHLSFVPSSIMAHGYFKNFIEQAVSELFKCQKEQRPVILNDTKELAIKDFSFTVLVPNDLSEDMCTKVSANRLRQGWEKVKIKAIGVRDFDFSVDASKITDGVLNLVDVPLTLNSLNTAIELYTGKKHIGQSFKEATIERREIRNFIRTLQYLINRCSLTRGIVKIELVEL